MVTVSELAVYPVKSFRQLSVNRWSVDSFGFAGDRRWMVMNRQTGKFVTSRTLPRMVLMACEVIDRGLRLTAPDMPELVVLVPECGSEVAATVWGDSCAALDAGDQAGQWCSHFLGSDCRLVYMPDTSFRQVDEEYADKGIRTGFADGFPFLLISEGSLELLNSKLDDDIPMKRFRPNIVVKGCEPHAEDSWKRIRIGELEFSVVKPCGRCVMTTVNTETAEKTKEPLRTLAGYRQFGKEVTFGQNLVHHDIGELSTGMSVGIIE